MNTVSIVTRATCIGTFALFAPAILPAQQPQFSGTWKLNLAQSQLSGITYTFDKKPSGVWHYSGGGFSADFDLAGKEYTMPSGVSVIGKAVSPRSWELTFQMKGTRISKSIVTLSGDSLKWVSEVPGPDGKTVQQTSTDTRISGGPGFLGKWKSGNPTGASSTLKITMRGAEGMRIEVPEFQQVVQGSLNGKDYPVMQAGQASKFTNSFAKGGPNSFTIRTKLDGKPFAVDVYTLSSDGKTLTDETTVTATNETTKSVFDRQ